MKTMNDSKKEEGSSASRLTQRGNGRKLKDTPRPDTPIILVFGLVGVGKTSFINELTGSNRPIGDPDSYTPCTEICFMVTTQIRGTEVSFVDIPGFGNPSQTNEENFFHIFKWLAENVGTSRKITAALFLQSMQQKGVESFEHGQREGLESFVSLVGNNFSKNVGLVSTHWDDVAKPTASLPEETLMEGLWKKLLGRGAHTFRVYNHEQRDIHILKMLLTFEPRIIQAQKSASDGKALLEAAERFDATDGPPHIPGAIDGYDEASLRDIVRQLHQAERGGLGPQAVDFVKAHWKMILFIATVSVGGIGVGLYLNGANAARVATLVAENTRLTEAARIATENARLVVEHVPTAVPTLPWWVPGWRTLLVMAVPIILPLLPLPIFTVGGLGVAGGITGWTTSGTTAVGVVRAAAGV